MNELEMMQQVISAMATDRAIMVQRCAAAEKGCAERDQTIADLRAQMAALAPAKKGGAK